MRLAEALRALLEAHNPKAFATPSQQQAAIEAAAALEEWDRLIAAIHAQQPAYRVAEQRAAFVDALGAP